MPKADDTKTAHQIIVEIKQLLKNLPSREEFFAKMDQLTYAYNNFIQEKTVLMHRFQQLEQNLAAPS